jgi:uroporphyrinogen decarboxylase
MALALDPDWVQEMFESNAYLVTKGAGELLKKGFQFDAAFVYDDLGYRNGLLFSPEMYRKCLKPYHKKIIDFFHEHNKPVILHSCGNVTEAVDDLIEAGFDCLQPLEVKAGMDMVGLKKKYGDRLSFMGGIDVRTMKNPDPLVIEEEIKTKITEAKKQGGYIYHSDHSVPDDISFQQYCRVMELVKQYGSYS